MSIMVQIRNMPDDLHRKLKSRAALAGMSLSDYLLREVQKSADLPTMEELQERLAARRIMQFSESHADAVRAERDSR
jgi:plasmid stability protein